MEIKFEDLKSFEFYDKAENEMLKQYKIYCKKNNISVNTVSFTMDFRKSYKELLKTGKYNGFIEFKYLNLKTKEDYLNYYKNKRLILKKFFDYSCIENKKETQKKVGGKSAKIGLDLEKYIINKINSGLFSENEIKQLFGNDLKLEKAVVLNKTMEKPDFSIVLKDNKNKKEVVKKVSQKSIQSKKKTNGFTHLHGTSSCFKLIQDFNSKGFFNNFSKQEKIDLEIMLNLMFNSYFFDEDKKNSFNKLLFSNKDDFNFWNKKEIFYKNVKTKDSGTGMNLNNFKAFFPKENDLLIKFFKKYSKEISLFFIKGEEELEFIFIVDTIEKKLFIYKIKDIFNEVYRKKDEINGFSETNKAIKINGFVRLAAKGSGGKKDLISKIKAKSSPQAQINLGFIKKNINPTLVKEIIFQ